MWRNLRARILLLVKTSYNWLFLGITLLGVIGLLGYLWWAKDSMPPQFPMFYSLTRGEQKLVVWDQLMGIVIVILGMLSFNFILVMVTIKRFPLIARILVVMNAVLVVLILVTLIQIARVIV